VVFQKVDTCVITFCSLESSLFKSGKRVCIGCQAATTNSWWVEHDQSNECVL